ncbi:flagellar brake protein [Paludibacterium yongneupense]|uniref:flagellar brake protein n=1 Tax=Paludibacterium yongneupense TaxID=400061 RepID=UPI00040E65C0|nr:flagellar brake protein [Paludibacterium yongneupense]
MSEEHRPGASGSASSPLDLAKYTLTSTVEIVHHLKTIAAQGHMVTVFSNRGKTFILTRLLAVDGKAGTLTFDWGSDEDTNTHLLASERNVFVCSPEGVKTQFITGQARKVDYEGQPAFQVDIPVQIIKLQRREFFRIRTPVGNPLLCHFGDYPEEALDLQTFDISLGGLSLWLPELNTPGFEIGQCYYDCALELKPFGILRVALEVRHRLPVQLRNGVDAVRIGCTFINLPTAMESQIQRYIGQLERERRALVR